MKIHEYKIEPFLGAKRGESKIFGAESFNSIDLCCADEGAIESVGPSVITTAKQLARATTFSRWACTMPADVVETADLPIRSARNEQRFTNEIGREIVSWIRHLMNMTNHLPRTRKNFLLLSAKRLCVPIKLGGKRPCSRNVGFHFDELSVGRHEKQFPLANHFKLRQAAAQSLQSLGLVRERPRKLSRCYSPAQNRQQHKLGRPVARHARRHVLSRTSSRTKLTRIVILTPLFGRCINSKARK